ncbi:MAG TPA: DUF87 domain-containing protein [Ktedonobacteraceae bacterium]|nr:DUF87 domain-containing protein [Ktedonobacteraceae bacterium]
MSVLHIDTSNKLQLQTQELVGRSVAVLGITGSGKTNTAAVLIEELLSSGLPLTIVDIEGEYWGLKEKFEVLVAGRSPHVEIEVDPTNADRLAALSVKRGISVILDVSDFHQEEIYEFLVRYFTGLWAASSEAKRPYHVILEEAHEFVPQNTSTPLKQILTRIALRGRKRGLGIVLISQRSAKVEKDLLTQASLLFLHKVVHPVDLRVYKDLIPLAANEVEEKIRKLQPGEVVVVANFLTSVVNIRLRHTFHAGSTPTHETPAHPKLRKLNTAVLSELRSLTLSSQVPSTTEDERVRLTRQVKELQEALTLKEAEIERLKNQVELLSKITISLEEMPGTALSTRTQNLEIAQALVGQVITTRSQQQTPTPHERSLSALSPTSDLPLGQVEQRKLETLVRRLQKLPRLQRSILRLLAEHEGTSMTVSAIATWLSLKESTIRSRPPHDLLKMKLIIRTRVNHGYRYVSVLSTFLKNEFPQAEPDIIIDNLLQKIDEGMYGKRSVRK